MKRSQVKELLREILNEDGVIGNVTAAVGAYQTPRAFAKKGQGKNVATKTAEHLGMKTVQRPKRPSHSKLVDYLDEHHFSTPHMFVSETEMANSPAVKKTEKLRYKKVKSTKIHTKKGK